MARVVIDEHGEKTYFNDNNDWHREDGPAVIWPNGYKEWRIDGEWMTSFYSCGSWIFKVEEMLFRYSLPNGLNTSRSPNGKQIWPKL